MRPGRRRFWSGRSSAAPRERREGSTRNGSGPVSPVLWVTSGLRSVAAARRRRCYVGGRYRAGHRRGASTIQRIRVTAISNCPNVITSRGTRDSPSARTSEGARGEWRPAAHRGLYPSAWALGKRKLLQRMLSILLPHGDKTGDPAAQARESTRPSSIATSARPSQQAPKRCTARPAVWACLFVRIPPGQKPEVSARRRLRRCGAMTSCLAETSRSRRRWWC